MRAAATTAAIFTSVRGREGGRKNGGCWFAGDRAANVLAPQSCFAGERYRGEVQGRGAGEKCREGCVVWLDAVGACHYLRPHGHRQRIRGHALAGTHSRPRTAPRWRLLLGEARLRLCGPVGAHGHRERPLSIHSYIQPSVHPPADKRHSNVCPPNVSRSIVSPQSGECGSGQKSNP